MVIRGPGIARGSTFDFPASNVDIAPTLLTLAGNDELASAMDGRSIAHLLVRADDTALLPATRHSLQRTAAAEANQPWRSFHPIEFAALNNHTWFGHLIDDVVSNTYRGLRFVADPTCVPKTCLWC